MPAPLVRQNRSPKKAATDHRSAVVDVRLPTLEAVKDRLQGRKPLVADVASFLAYDGPEITGPATYHKPE